MGFGTVVICILDVGSGERRTQEMFFRRNQARGLARVPQVRSQPRFSGLVRALQAVPGPSSAGVLFARPPLIRQLLAFTPIALYVFEMNRTPVAKSV